MGRMKEIWIENEEAISVLTDLENILSNASPEMNNANPRIARVLNLSMDIKHFLFKSPTYNRQILDIINNEISEKVKSISDCFQSTQSINDVNLKYDFSLRLIEIEALLVNCKVELKIKEEKENLNSTEFYKKRLEDLEIQIKTLASEKEQNSKKAKLKDEEIKRLSVVIKEAQKQLDEKRRQEDAQRNWNQKIEEAFKKLNEYQAPLITEKKRLQVLFWFFGILCIITVVVLSLTVFLAAHRIYTADVEMTFAKYLPYYSPIPIIGILLWVFIVQMNREQRQLIIMTQHLHNLSYTEGLLKSINIFAPGIEDAVNRINATVDKLLDNHLSLHPALILKEESLSRNEKNHSPSLSEMISLLKEIKELVK